MIAIRKKKVVTVEEGRLIMVGEGEVAAQSGIFPEKTCRIDGKALE